MFVEAMKATRAAKPAVVEPKPRPDAFALFKLAGMKRDSREQCGICNQSVGFYSLFDSYY